MRKTPVVVVLFILSLFVLAGCDQMVQEASPEKVARYQANYEIIGTEKEEMLDHVSETVYETGDRSNRAAEEVLVNAVKPGEKITVPSGRYQITGQMTGNVYIHDENGNLLFHDILSGPYGVESITIDLNETNIVSVDGLDQVAVSPVATQLSTDLTAGIWEVGTDIEEGNYSITGDDGFGYLQVFDPNENPSVYEVIGGAFASTESEVQLYEGQKLRITGISLIHFQLNEG